MPAPAPLALRVCNSLLLGALAVLVLIEGSSLVSYLLQPESYRFGTEVGGWAYRSRAHYLSSTLVGLLIALGGGLLSFLSSHVSRTLVLRLLAFLLDIVLLTATAPRE